MSTLMISVSGLRGIIGNGLTPIVALKFASALGKFCNSGTIVIGRDARKTGLMIERAALSGLMAAGCKVINIGLAATPTIQLAVDKLNADGGIAITASHNPVEWNALKLMGKRGIFLNERDGLTVRKLAESGEDVCLSHDRIGSVSTEKGFNKVHIDTILNSSFISPDIIRRKNYKVVVDCINGAGSYILPELFKELGCDVIRLNCEANGEFVHGAEPVPENLTDLSAKVAESGADAGFACDPDGDRLALVDEKGIPLGEEYSLVLAVKHILSKTKGGVAANVSTTMALDDVVKAAGGTLFRSKVGEAYVVNVMIEHNCVIGGEGNGGVISPEIHYGRDAMVGAAIVLQLMADSDRTLGQIQGDLPKYYISKKKTTLVNKNPDDIIQKIEKEASGAELDYTDGLKLIYPGKWIHLRKSNTEPIIRVITEAATQEEADSLSEKYINLIENL